MQQSLTPLTNLCNNCNSILANYYANVKSMAHFAFNCVRHNIIDI